MQTRGHTCVYTTTHTLTFANTAMLWNIHLYTHRLIYAQGMYGSYKNKFGLFLWLVDFSLLHFIIRCNRLSNYLFSLIIHSSIHPSIYPFIQKMFMTYLLRARSHARCWRHNCGKADQAFDLLELTVKQGIEEAIAQLHVNHKLWRAPWWRNVRAREWVTAGHSCSRAALPHLVVLWMAS